MLQFDKVLFSKQVGYVGVENASVAYCGQFGSYANFEAPKGNRSHSWRDAPPKAMKIG
jgi:hypothetical protein